VGKVALSKSPTTQPSRVSNIVWTPKQYEALSLIRDPANKHVMLVGGARSGKTYVDTSAICYRAQHYPGSRHLIARLRFSHAKASIWLDTLDKALRGQSHPSLYSKNETDHYVKLTNGSEIWVDGLDDKDRVDKILGREYCTIFFNEISQLSYETVTTVITRLAQNIPGCRPLALYDLNPAGELHWANQLFNHGLRPDGTAVGPGYASLIINPYDNQTNLPEGYIHDFLESLPDHKRRRFLLGEWTDPEGVIFQDWEVIDEIPDEVKLHSRHTNGLDFGFSVDPAVVVSVWLNGDDLYVDERLYQTGLTNPAIARLIKPDNGPPLIEGFLWADSAEPKSIVEISQHGIEIGGARKGADSVRAGIDWLLSKRVHITRRSANILLERSNYTWQTDPTGRQMAKPIDDYNHAMDAIRYAANEWIAYGMPTIEPGVRL